LIQLADLAYGARDYEALRQLSDALDALPFAPAKRAASYYKAVLLKRAEARTRLCAWHHKRKQRSKYPHGSCLRSLPVVQVTVDVVGALPMATHRRA
jgi:hypothetical protein